MGVFKNKVGRPSKRIIKTRRLLTMLLVVLVATSVFVLSNLTSIKKLKGLTTDVTAPVLTYFELSQSVAKTGDAIDVNTDAKDDLTGISQLRVYYTDDSDVWSGESFEANVIDGVMYVPTNAKPGVYQITYIYLSDMKGNNKMYATSALCDAASYEFKSNGYCTSNIKTSKLEVLQGDDKQDVTAPVINNVNIDKNSAKAGEKIKISASVSDDYSGVSSVFVLFKSLSQGLNLVYNAESKNYEGEYNVPMYGTDLVIDSIRVEDNNQNSQIYLNESLYPTYSNKKFNVSPVKILNGINDNSKPELVSYSIAKEKVDAPYELPITIKTKDDTGISDAYAYIYKKDDKTYAETNLQAYFYDCTLKDGNNVCDTTILLDQYVEEGSYVIGKITLTDLAGNKVTYSINPKNDELKLSDVKDFEITSTFKYDLVVSTAQSDIVSKIKSAKNDANISIDCNTYSVIDKDVFDAIKGTNKTIYVESNGITWIFNGKDIKRSKDLDTSIDFNYLYNDELNDLIKPILNKAFVINFTNNGKLPGKALIRIKADYTLKNYIGVKDLTVLYYDRASKMFDYVARKINLSDNGYYEFYISHNSSYLISSDEPEEKYISDNTEDLKINEEYNASKKKDAKNIKSESVDNTSNNNSNLIMIITVIVFILIILLVMFIVIKKKNNKKRKEKIINNKK